MSNLNLSHVENNLFAARNALGSEAAKADPDKTARALRYTLDAIDSLTHALAEEAKRS